MNYVYIVQAKGTNYFKIGRADAPEQRLAQLQIGCPHELEKFLTIPTLFPNELESALHEILADHLVRGEWFEIEPDTLKAILEDVSIPGPKYFGLHVDGAGQQRIVLTMPHEFQERTCVGWECTSAGELEYLCKELVVALLKIWRQARKQTRKS